MFENINVGIFFSFLSFLLALCNNTEHRFVSRSIKLNYRVTLHTEKRRKQNDYYCYYCQTRNKSPRQFLLQLTRVMILYAYYYYHLFFVSTFSFLLFFFDEIYIHKKLAVVINFFSYILFLFFNYSSLEWKSY